MTRSHQMRGRAAALLVGIVILALCSGCAPKPQTEVNADSPHFSTAQELREASAYVMWVHVDAGMGPQTIDGTPFVVLSVHIVASVPDVAGTTVGPSRAGPFTPGDVLSQLGLHE
ncbi:MAG: hypothetical protein FWD75_03610 [Propionibacteriaceae bacterium]|nr:hypothetical protein [Propionibacteriaceae bacterium]